MRPVWYAVPLCPSPGSWDDQREIPISMAWWILHWHILWVLKCWDTNSSEYGSSSEQCFAFLVLMVSAIFKVSIFYVILALYRGASGGKVSQMY